MKEQVFVGRDHELEELHGYLGTALAGEGQVCFATGQAGSGKTALVRPFVAQALAADPDLIVASGSCNAQTGVGDPYLPFREALAMLTGDTAAQSSGNKIAPENTPRLRTVLVRSVQVLVETAPELVGLFVPGASLVGALGRAVVKKAGWMDQLDDLATRKVGAGEPAPEQGRIFEQYTAFLQRFTAKNPLILFLDDLQWADNASLGLLFHLGRHLEASRILILGAFRPGDVALGRSGQRHPLEPVVNELTRYFGDVSVDLDAIPETTNREFVDDLLDAAPNNLGQAFRDALFRQTAGHALFTVELIHAMQERGDLVQDAHGRWVEGPALDWSALPARVEGVVAERIARLSDELRQLLTVGSVEGERFTAEVVARVQALSDRQVVRELSNELQRQHRLVGALGLVEYGRVRLSLYRFQHALFQQYLYGNLDQAERMYLHRDVGTVLEALFAGQTEEVAAQLARHFEEGGIPAKAVAYRLQAGNRAHRMSAHMEATAHLTRGLELLAELPTGPERMQRELGLQTSLAIVLSATTGYASPDVERAYVRAHDLCQAMGNPPQTIPVRFGLCLFHTLRGEMEKARQDGDQLLLLANQARDTNYLLAGHTQLGIAALHQGDLERSRWHLSQGIALYDPRFERDVVNQVGTHPAVISFLYMSWVLWLQGYPEQAFAKMEAGLRLAEALNHAYTCTLAVYFSSILCQLARLWPECQTQADWAANLADQGHYVLWQTGCTILRGSVLAHQGRLDEGITALREGLVGSQATGSRLGLTCNLASLAEAYLIAEKRDEGLRVLDESFRMVEEVYWLAEQHRLRAELLHLAPGNEQETEAILRKSLGVARSQKARSLELRAATSMARLLQKQDRVDEGRDLLAACYAWFTEGFDTPDLREARDLLGQLPARGHEEPR